MGADWRAECRFRLHRDDDARLLARLRSQPRTRRGCSDLRHAAGLCMSNEANAASHTKLTKDQNAVVTGASSGIGRAVAIALAEQGYRISLVARRRAALEETAAEIRGMGTHADVYCADISIDEDLASRAA